LAPVSVAKDPEKMRQVIKAFKDAIELYRNSKNKQAVYNVFTGALSSTVTKKELEVLKITLDTILRQIDKGLDSIWVFMLSNIYAPALLAELKFDVVVGNPPWIVLRSIENVEYQDFVKQQVLAYGLLESHQTHLYTQMEVATLFFCRVSDLYLKDSGVIAFVMPHSVLTGALHHVNFKKFKKPPMKLVKY